MEAITIKYPAIAPEATGQTYRSPFAIMTVLFFMWGFMTVWNDVLIPRFKDAFTLRCFPSLLAQFAFFDAYGIGSLIYYLISMTSGITCYGLSGYKSGRRKPGSHNIAELLA